MPKNSGRTGTPGNKAGASCKINIAMPKPMIGKKMGSSKKAMPRQKRY